MGEVYYCGCDIGSTYSKAIILDADGKIVGQSLIRTGIDPEQTSRDTIGAAMKGLPGIKDISEFAYLVGTGYGRNEVPFADENVSEISCHAMGVHTVDPAVRTIVDVGGQDVKGISVDVDGTVRDFVMNDKCAAGTGRFYEGICRLLNVDMPGISELSAKATNVCQITSQCTVFAESEIISLLAHKFPSADVCAGIQHSVAKRCLTFLKGVGIVEKITMTGGCAKNKGLIKALEEIGHIKITPLSIDPQLMGCLGAATIARRKGMYLAQNKSGANGAA